jgi:hypothetical protein
MAMEIVPKRKARVNSCILTTDLHKSNSWLEGSEREPVLRTIEQIWREQGVPYILSERESCQSESGAEGLG